LKLVVTDVLVAAGRNSNTCELKLEAAGLTPGERGLISVDQNYRSEVPHIYAAGDVIGAPALAATGIKQARVAVCHAFQILDKELSPLLPTGIFTIPEVGMAGDTEQALRKKGIQYIVGRADYGQNPRGRIIGDEAGFLKLLFRADDLHLLGVHMIGEQATELVHIGLVAMACGANAGLFSNVCFNYPTLGNLYKYASYDALMRQLKRT
jgi:NAD(P) transhydrogenase